MTIDPPETAGVLDTRDRTGMVALRIFLLGVLCFSVGEPLDINRDLLNAMQYVESKGDSCAKGDNGQSLGAYQIMKGYYDDAAEFNPSLKDGGYTYNNVVGLGGKEYSERVMMSFIERYATPERLGRTPTYEDIARIHNGGPNGFRRDSTLPYRDKVNECLQSPGRCPLSSPKRSADLHVHGNMLKERSNKLTCKPACSAGDCMCSCCSDIGICNCLTREVLAPCISSISNTSRSDAETMGYGTASLLFSITMGFWLNTGVD